MYYNSSPYETAIMDAFITMSTAYAQLKHCKTSQWYSRSQLKDKPELITGING